MPREIQLDGTEISIIKAIGLGSGEIDGESLIERCAELEFAELMDSLKGLIAIGYVESDGFSMHNKEDLEKAHFHVNSGYAKDLKDALDPREEPKKSKRVRRE
jgi:hypothetical protein